LAGVEEGQSSQNTR